jgi:hypothetical protein
LAGLGWRVARVVLVGQVSPVPATGDRTAGAMLTALVGAAGLLLLGAGGAKVVDPARTVGALAALGLPVSPTVVRVGAAGEAVLGAVTLVVGGRVPAVLVGVSFAAFASFVLAALRSGRPIGTCGCFGRADTPPRPSHVAVDVVFAAAGVAGAVVGVAPVLDSSVPETAAAVALAVGAYLLFTRTPGAVPTP